MKSMKDWVHERIKAMTEEELDAYIFEMEKRISDSSKKHIIIRDLLGFAYNIRASKFQKNC